MEIALIIEVISVAFGLIYLLLMMRENIWCWLFGILSSLLSIYLFMNVQLYSECILYAFYVGVGVYGWLRWSKPKKTVALKIKRWPIQNHGVAIPLGMLSGLGLGFFMDKYTNSDMSYADAFSTVFSFIASFMEAHKVLSAWVYWIMINGFSIWLYFSKDLHVYGGLMVVYFFMSFGGLYMWNKKLQQQH